MPEPLTAVALAAALAELPNWRVENDALVRQCRFADFATAMRFFHEAAADCEALNHHPTWSNTYDRVEIRLTTHDAGDRVTALDVQLAHRLETTAQRLLPGPEAADP